jgi:RNA polymerase sigma-70 factor (ECF subfamily)
VVSDFHLLLEEQIPQLMRYASALTRDPEEAAELVEDTVRDALAHRREYRGAGDIRVWLLTLLHDLRGNPFRQATAPLGAASRDATVLLTLSDLDRALGELSEEQRAIILLIGLEGMSYQRTASILRLSVGSVRSRLSRGRTALREAIGVDRAAHRGKTARVARAA